MMFNSLWLALVMDFYKQFMPTTCRPMPKENDE